MTEIKMVVPCIEKLELKSKIVEEKDEDGNVSGGHVQTTVKFEYEGNAGRMNDVMTALANGHEVHVLFGSPQAIMAMADKEPVAAKD